MRVAMISLQFKRKIFFKNSKEDTTIASAHSHTQLPTEGGWS